MRLVGLPICRYHFSVIDFQNNNKQKKNKSEIKVLEKRMPLLLEVKLPYGSVCPFVGRSVGRSFGLSVIEFHRRAREV